MGTFVNSLEENERLIVFILMTNFDGLKICIIFFYALVESNNNNNENMVNFITKSKIATAKKIKYRSLIEICFKICFF